MRRMRQKGLLPKSPSYDNCVGEIEAALDQVLAPFMDANALSAEIARCAAQAGISRIAGASGSGSHMSGLNPVMWQAAALGEYMQERALYDALERVFRKRFAGVVLRLKQETRDKFAGRLARLEAEAEADGRVSADRSSPAERSQG